MSRYASLLLAVVAAALPAACSSTNNTVTPPPGDASTADTPGADTPGTDAPATDTPGADAPQPPDGGPPAGAATVTGFLGDGLRAGANRAETQLTPARVSAGFGRDMSFAPQLQGETYGQPLYMPQVNIGGRTRAVLYVATEANAVFALDALTGETLWRTDVGPTVSRSQQGCGNINTIGVTSTPVIDPASRTLYAVSFNNDGGLRFKLNALDLTTGMQRAGYPAAIDPPAQGSSSFDPRVTGQRGAIAFRDGRVYVPFGGLYGDCGIYHGWVVAISAANPTQQTAFATPGRGSGLWAPGGLTMDGQGRIFVATGNSTPLGGHTPGSLGEFVLRLGTGASGPTFSMGDMAAQFSPSDARTLDLQDLDIGSVAPLLLPGSPSRLLQGGKAGTVYLLDADNLGGSTPVFQQRVCTGGIFGAMASWNDGTNTWAFVPVRGSRSGCSGSNGVMALRVEGGSRFSTAWCTASISGANPPVVSSNGDRDGILWVAGASTGLGGSASLRAYDISNGMEIYGNAEPPPSVRQWVPPLVVDGRVYVTGSSTISMFRAR